MTIFVGLGNNDAKYHNTKHNIGFWIMDHFAEKHNLNICAEPGVNGY